MHQRLQLLFQLLKSTDSPTSSYLSYCPARVVTMSESSSWDIYKEKFTPQRDAGRKKSNDNAHISSLRMFTAIIFIGVYGILCYQMGASSRYLSPSFQMEMHAANRYEISQQSKRVIDESELPYRCGVVFFYHIPSTGGVSNTWY